MKLLIMYIACFSVMCAKCNFFRLIIASAIISFCTGVGFSLVENHAPRYLKGVPFVIAVSFSLSKIIDLSGDVKFVARMDFCGLTFMLANL